MRKDRLCLRCEGVFSSPGPHIRKCGTCHQEEGVLASEFSFRILEQGEVKKRKGKRTRSRKEPNH